MAGLEERGTADRGVDARTLDDTLAGAGRITRRAIPLYSPADLVRRAQRIHTILSGNSRERQWGPAERQEGFRTLIALYDEMDRRVRAAPMGDDGLPRLKGIRWDPGSPLAGTTADISPFQNLDWWHVNLRQMPAVQRTRRIRPTVTDTPQPIPNISIDVRAGETGQAIGSIMAGNPPNFDGENAIMTFVRSLGLGGSIGGLVASSAVATFVAGLFGAVMSIVGAIGGYNQINQHSLASLQRQSARATFMLLLGIVNRWERQGFVPRQIVRNDFLRNSMYTQARQQLQHWVDNAQVVGSARDRQRLVREVMDGQINYARQNVQRFLARIDRTIIEQVEARIRDKYPSIPDDRVSRISSRFLRESRRDIAIRAFRTMIREGLSEIN